MINIHVVSPKVLCPNVSTTTTVKRLVVWNVYPVSQELRRWVYKIKCLGPYSDVSLLCAPYHLEPNRVDLTTDGPQVPYALGASSSRGLTMFSQIRKYVPSGCEKAVRFRRWTSVFFPISHKICPLWWRRLSPFVTELAMLKVFRFFGLGQPLERWYRSKSYALFGFQAVFDKSENERLYRETEGLE